MKPSARSQTRVAIMQPTYMPWLGYFNLMAEADVFILLDTADFSKNSFHNRNRIKLGGTAHYLTIPVLHKLGTKLRDQQIAEDGRWTRKHLQSLKAAYGKAPHYDRYSGPLAESILLETNDLCDITVPIILQIRDWLGLGAKTLLASEMTAPESTESGPVEKVLQLLELVGGRKYLSPLGAYGYIEKTSLLQENGIEVWYQRYEHPVYQQIGNNFIDHLGVVDLLFNHGPESTNIITSGSHFEPSQNNQLSS